MSDSGILRGASKVIWKDISQTAMTDSNRTSDLAWTDLDLSAKTSPKAKFAIVILQLKADTVGSGNRCYFKLRKNGATATHLPVLTLDKAGTTAGVYFYQQAIIGLDSEQVIEYMIDVDTGWQIDSYLRVQGYIE